MILIQVLSMVVKTSFLDIFWISKGQSTPTGCPPPLTKHDVVFRVSVHVLLVQTTRKQLHVTAPTVDILLVLHRELYHQCLALVAERFESSGQRVKSGILACLQPCGMGVSSGGPPSTLAL